MASSELANKGSLNREELAWAAGLFDGEGWINIMHPSNRPGYQQLEVGLTQTDRQVLDRFKSAVGNLGSVYGPYGPRKLGWSSYFRWQTATFEKGQAVIAMLWNFLSPVKKAQATEVLLEMRRYYNGYQV